MVLHPDRFMCIYCALEYVGDDCIFVQECEELHLDIHEVPGYERDADWEIVGGRPKDRDTICKECHRTNLLIDIPCIETLIMQKWRALYFAVALECSSPVLNAIHVLYPIRQEIEYRGRKAEPYYSVLLNETILTNLS